MGENLNSLVWTTVKIPLTNFLNDETKTIDKIHLYCDDVTDAFAGGTHGFKIDYMRIAPSNEIGWSHDCSTTDGSNSPTTSATATTDGDKQTITATANDGRWTFYDDVTTTDANISMTYYPFVEFSITSVIDTDSGGDVWKLKAYGDVGAAIVSDYTDTTGVFRFNLDASITGDFDRFVFEIADNGESFVIDYIKIFSIANYTYTASGALVNEYCYVDSGTLYNIGNHGWLYYEPDLGVSTTLYPVWNISTTTDLTQSGTQIQWRPYNDASLREYFYDETRGDFLAEATLNNFYLYLYDDFIISNITFIASNQFNIGVPLEPYKNHKIDLLFETYMGYMSQIYLGFQNFSVLLVNETLTFPDSTTYDYTSNVLRFSFDIKYSINSFKLTISDNQSTKLCTYLDYLGISKSNKWFNISSTLFHESIVIIYSLSGSVNYATDFILDDSLASDESTYSLFSATIDYTALTDETHYHTSTLFMTGFQFYRARLTMEYYTTSYSEVNDGLDLIVENKFTFYEPDGTIKYTIYLDSIIDVGTTLGTASFYIQIKKGAVTVFENDIVLPDTPLNANGEYYGMFAVWKDQENYLWFKYNKNAFLTDTLTEEWVYWQSDEALENFQCTVFNEYAINYAGDGLAYYANIANDETEYSYGNIKGVSEPHFSTSWWEGIPIIQQLIEGFIWLGNMLIGGINFIIDGFALGVTVILDSLYIAISGLGDVLYGLFEGIINTIIGILDSLYDVLNDLASEIWDFFTGILDTIYDGISALYDGVTAFFTDVFDNLTVWITDFIDVGIIASADILLQAFLTVISGALETSLNFVGGIFGLGNIGTGIIGAITGFAGSITGFFSVFGTALALGGTIITVIGNIIVTYGGYIPTAIVIYVLFDLFVLTGFDFDKIFEKAGKYANIGDRILNLSWSVVNAIIQFIGGIIP